VARPRLRRAMRPPLAALVARTAAPAAPLTAFWPRRGCRSRTAGRVSRSGLDRTGRGDTQRDALTRAGIQSPHRPSANAECHGVEAKELCLGNNHADPAAQGDRQRVRDYGSKPSDRGQRQRVCPRVVHAGTKLSVTATVSDGFRHVSYHGNRCVKNQHLCDKKPTSNQSSTSGGGRIRRAPCPSGSSVESGLIPDAIAVCHRYPQVKAFYGKRASGAYNGQGRALDCMISDSTVGWDLAKWVRANAKRLGVSEVICRQQIRTVQRSSEGWRSMSDRGSQTANHMDHVHVSGLRQQRYRLAEDSQTTLAQLTREGWT
jgi:hypothetical protein